MVASSGLVALVLLVAGKGVLRWAGMGLPWADEFSGILLLWVCFLGALLATAEGRHITIEILDRSLTLKARAVFSVLAGFVAAGFCGLLAVLAVGFILQEKEAGTLTTVLKVPLWQVRLVLVPTFAILSFRFLLRTLGQWEQLRNQGGEGGGP